MVGFEGPERGVAIKYVPLLMIHKCVIVLQFIVIAVTKPHYKMPVMC